MKNILNYIVFFMAAIVLVGCDSDDDSLDHTAVSTVNALYSPQDNEYFNLGAQSTANFEWEAAKAEDNGVVLYDVAFFQEGSDFSEPLYVMPSDGNGLQRTLTLPFANLNRIATMAGIQPQSIGTLQWTVWSSKGLNVQKSEIYRTIEVERPGGFTTPDELYITGSGTEAGEDLGSALAFKKTGTDTYEIYTRLSAGDYQFVTRNSGDPETFYVDGSDLKAGGSTTFSGTDGVYRIRVDFSDGSVSMTMVEKVELYFSPNDEYLFELPYNGNGTWMAEEKNIVFRQEDWGRDERYKFKFTTSDGEEWFGSVNADNQRPNADTDQSYWNMVPVNNDRWANTFKFATEVDENINNVEVIFNSTVPEYTHVITVLD